MLAHRQFLAADLVVLGQFRAFQQIGPGRLQIHQFDIRPALYQALFDKDLGADEIAAELRQRVDILRRQFHLLVFQQPAHQLCARVGYFFAGIGFAGRQQHPRLDLDQHRRHQ